MKSKISTSISRRLRCPNRSAKRNPMRLRNRRSPPNPSRRRERNPGRQRLPRGPRTEPPSNGPASSASRRNPPSLSSAGRNRPVPARYNRRQEPKAKCAPSIRAPATSNSTNTTSVMRISRRLINHRKATPALTSRNSSRNPSNTAARAACAPRARKPRRSA